MSMFIKINLFKFDNFTFYKYVLTAGDLCLSEGQAISPDVALSPSSITILKTASITIITLQYLNEFFF